MHPAYRIQEVTTSNFFSSMIILVLSSSDGTEVQFSVLDIDLASLTLIYGGKSPLLSSLTCSPAVPIFSRRRSNFGFSKPTTVRWHCCTFQRGQIFVSGAKWSRHSQIEQMSRWPQASQKKKMSLKHTGKVMARLFIAQTFRPWEFWEILTFFVCPVRKDQIPPTCPVFYWQEPLLKD